MEEDHDHPPGGDPDNPNDAQDSTPDEAEGRKRPDRAAKIKENAQLRFRAAKMRLKTVCPSEAMRDVIDRATTELSRATTIAAKLLHLYVLQQITARPDLELEITQTTFKHCIDIVGRVPETLGKEPDLAALAQTHFFSHLPPDFQTPDVTLAGNNGRQYIAKQWLVNAKNHVALNLDNRHRKYVESIVGRWYDALPADCAPGLHPPLVPPPSRTATEIKRDRSRVIRTVQCASLVCRNDPDVIRKNVQEKRAQFLVADERKSKPEPKTQSGEPPKTKTGIKRRRKTKDEKDDDDSGPKPFDSTWWLERHEDILVRFACQIRTELGVERHSTVSVSPHFTRYLPFLLRVQRRQEWECEQAEKNPPSEAHVKAKTRDPKAFYRTRGFRPMSLLPNCGFDALHLTIDDHVLGHLHRHAARNVISASLDPKDVRSLWTHYFELGKLARPNGRGAWKIVENFVQTDGVGATVRFARPLRAEEGEKQKVADRDEHLFRWRRMSHLENRHVIAVDPGRRDLFTALKVRMDVDGEDEKRADHQTVHTETGGRGVRRCSNGEYRKMAGSAAAERRQRRLMRDNSPVRKFQDGLPPFRSSDPAKVAGHLEHCATPGGIAAAALYGGMAARRKRFERYRESQQAMDAMCKRLLSCAEESATAARRRRKRKLGMWRSDVVVAFGDAGFSHTSRGLAAGPTKGLKRNLARYCAVVDVDEFRSSKLCSRCFEVLSDKEKNGESLNWGVRRCTSTECCAFWNRDVNASRNIGRTFLCKQRGWALPGGFQRGWSVGEREGETFYFDVSLGELRVLPA